MPPTFTSKLSDATVMLALSPDEKRLYTTNGVSSDVSVIDLEANKVIKSLGVGQAPWGVIAKP